MKNINIIIVKKGKNWILIATKGQKAVILPYIFKYREQAKIKKYQLLKKL